MSRDPRVTLVQGSTGYACAAGGTRAPPQRPKWLRRAAGATLILCGSLAGSGCDHGGGGDPYNARDNGSGSGGYLGYGAPVLTYEAYCGNGLDDDLDGRIDCADSDCVRAGNCWTPGLGGAYGVPVPAAVEICGNGLDDDWDGRYDCADSDCTWSAACAPPGEGVGGVYGAGGDPGGAGDVAGGPGQGGAPGSAGVSGAGSGGAPGGGGGSVPPEDCVNEADDDWDGLADCEDPDCFGHPFCPAVAQGGNAGGGGAQGTPPPDAGAAGTGIEATEVSCSDGVDNDRDGVADCIDPDCKHAAACGAHDGASGAGGLGSAGAAGLSF